MNVKEIRELYEATPFEPFELVLPNGTAILVDHPEFMSFSRDFRTVYVSKLNGGAHRIDVKLIVGINEAVRQQKKKKK